METVLAAAAALAAGALAAWAIWRGKLAAAHAAAKMERELHGRETKSLREAHARETQSLRTQIESERAHAREMREETDRQWAEKFETLRQEMRNTAAEQLAAKQSALQAENRQQMAELLKPVREQFADFRKSVEESRTKAAENKTELQHSFETAMKLFQQEQRQAVEAIKEQTARIGNDAANLTKALKGDSKAQGDWGEMVLQTILENSGLRKGEEYFVQENVRDTEGNNFRPDVVVRFPEGRSVVIDSKVSLTAYAEAIAATDPAEQERLVREHVRSMRKHIDGLAEKDYGKLVRDSIGFVLMFVPNEAGYMAAMRVQPEILRYAYARHVVIISPGNLLMALQLAYSLWQYDRQNKNVERIVKAAADLYDKVAGFEETFTSVGELLKRLSAAYEGAKKQLYEGNGNVMRRVEGLRSLGITPKKQLRDTEPD